jgi:hypothetical protein
MSSLENFHNVVADIESAKELKFVKPLESRGLELTPFEYLVSDLSGNYGALLVRFVLFQLGIGEDQVLKWRLENKYRQYQIFNYYSPGCMPHTLGLSEMLNQDQGIQKARDLFAKGYFLKATLGDASFITRSWDKTKEFDDIFPLHSSNNALYESYMLQKKLRLRREFRVHTFCNDVIPMLTYRIPNTQHFNNHHEAEKFVSAVLNKLPAQISKGTLIGWDVGLTSKDEYFVIEANFTGFHTEYRRGFQTTGYVDNHQFGPIICAWLNMYFAKYYGIYIESIDPLLLADYPFYKAFIYYSALFIDNRFDTVMHKQAGISLSVIMYIDDISNVLLLNLLNHFLNVDFADNYYVIVNPVSFLVASALFKRPQVKLIDESQLFTVQQYQALIQMGYDRKKQICCYHMARKMSNEPYFII